MWQQDCGKLCVGFGLMGFGLGQFGGGVFGEDRVVCQCDVVCCIVYCVYDLYVFG